MHIYNSLGDDHSTPASSTPSKPVKESQGNINYIVYDDLIFVFFIVYRDPELAKRVFKKHLVDLSNLMTIPDNMSVIALQLYSEDLIPDDTYDNIITSNKSGRDKANSLLHALRATISIEPQSLKTLIEVLRRNKAFKAIADKMDEDVSSHI